MHKPVSELANWSDLKKSLSNNDFAAVLAWWESLTSEQQRDLSDAASPPSETFSPLPVPDKLDPDDERYPFFEYLINHELRVVNFVADAEAKSSHRIVSSYLASLGSDFRHGEFGTVR